MSTPVSIEVDRKTAKVHDGLTVKQALEIIGYKTTKYPEKSSQFAPCEVGGCWSCAVLVDDQLKPACITPIREGVSIKTEPSTVFPPKRIVRGFSGHSLGGVGTPWWLKRYRGYIEAACFAAGCNFRCPQCRTGRPPTPVKVKH